MTTALTASPALFSSLARDPDMVELVEMFVEELPDRMASLQAAFDSTDWENLARYAHQLKGAAGSYGFDALTAPLKQLEQKTRERVPQEELSSVLRDVLELGRRVRSGVPE